MTVTPVVRKGAVENRDNWLPLQPARLAAPGGVVWLETFLLVILIASMIGVLL
jgi:hypothetical protein